MTSARAATHQLDQTCIDTIRTLCIDAIEAANSGHPGTPTGVRALDPEYEFLGEPAVGLDDPKRFRQLGSKCPLGWARYAPHAVTEVARGVLR